MHVESLLRYFPVPVRPRLCMTTFAGNAKEIRLESDDFLWRKGSRVVSSGNMSRYMLREDQKIENFKWTMDMMDGM